MERYDLSMKRGETFELGLVFKRDGEPVDLTGYEAKCQVREYPDGGALLCDVNTLITPEIGRVDLVIGSSVSAGFVSGAYVWDIRMTDELGAVRYYLGGYFKVLPSVTE